MNVQEKGPTVLQSRTGRVILWLAVFLCASQGARASDLLVRRWIPSQDVRQRSILALLETRDGYLWIGTGKGLLRFDGVGFTSFTAANTPGILGDRISFGTLWEDAQGAVWAGTDFSGVLRNDHGHWQTFQTRQGLFPGKVLRIDGDQAGAVWIYTEAGLSRWSNGHLERMQATGGSANSPGELVPFSRDRPIDFAKAGLWRHRAGVLERFVYGHWTRFPTPVLQRPFEDDVREIYEDASRRVWYSLSSQQHTFFCVEDGRLRRLEGLPARTLVSFQDRAGDLWLTDHEAHSALWSNGHLHPLPELSAPFLLHVLETRNGTLWAGTAGTDLYQFHRRSVDIVPIPGAPEIASVLFQKRNGEVWAGGTDVLRLLPDAGGFSLTPTQDHRPLRPWIQIKALAEDPQGNLLIGSRGVEGVERLGPAGLQHVASVSGTVQAMLLTQAGTATWIGSSTGLYRYDGRAAQRVASADVRSLLQLPSGDLLAGTEKGPLLLKSGEQVTRAIAPWTFGPVLAMTRDRAGDVWLATQDRGLVLFAQGSLHPYALPEGLPTNVVYSLQFDALGDLWITSDVGLIRVRGRSIQRKRSNPPDWLQIKVFDAADGLPASIFDPLGSQGVLSRPNGDLWFGTERGIAVVRPSRLLTPVSHLHTVIEEHEINQSGPAMGSIVMRPGQTDLQIQYTALGSDHPEQLAFRYRIQQYDRDWVYAEGRHTAFYSHLAPGSYTFQVQAADNDGEGWVGNVASTTVVVLTPFYRSWWFRSLLLLSLGSFLLYVLEVRRRRRVTDQRNRQMFTRRLITTQEGERKRIAHELHDSIGQHLVLIRTLALLPPTASPPPAAGGHLQAIADQAAVAIREVETISYGLRPYQLDRLGLTKAVQTLVQSFERSSTVQVECALSNVDGFFAKDMEINFYRIVQEAMSNVFRHAEATSVRVAVTRTDTGVRLLIQDNGKGFFAGESHGSSLGLVGIQERAEALHGRASIESVPGVGTTVLLEATPVPARH